MISTKAIVAYLGFAVGMTALFVYLRFPDQAMNAYVEQRLAAIDPGLSITTAATRPTLPPGVKLTAVDLKRNGQRLTHIDTARILPDLRSLLKPDKALRFTASLADGTLDGLATITNRHPSGLLRLTVDLNQIRLEKIDAIQRIESFALTGVLRGHLTHDASRNPSGATHGSLSATGLRINLKAPFFGLSELVMEKTDAEFTMSGGSLRLTALTFDGPMVEGKISGVIDIRQPLEKSNLNLTGNAKPRPDLLARLQELLPSDLGNVRTLGTRGLNFRIRGTADNPDLSMR